MYPIQSIYVHELHTHTRIYIYDTMQIDTWYILNFPHNSTKAPFYLSPESLALSSGTLRRPKIEWSDFYWIRGWQHCAEMIFSDRNRKSKRKSILCLSSYIVIWIVHVDVDVDAWKNLFNFTCVCLRKQLCKLSSY